MGPVPAYIAMVDDDAAARTAFGRLLRCMGFEVAVFESGQAFLASLAVRAPRCVLLDLRMPGMSGLEVLSRVTLAAPAVRVIIVTADPTDKAARALAAGAVACLQKPVDAADLLRAIQEALTAP